MYRATTGGLNTWRTMEPRSVFAWNSFDLETTMTKKTHMLGACVRSKMALNILDSSNRKMIKEYLDISVLLVFVESDVVSAVGDRVFLHPLVTDSAPSPLCVDSRHLGLIPKVHLQPLFAIIIFGHPRGHSRVIAAEVQPGVRGPKMTFSFWWRGDLAVRDAFVLHTQRLGAV